MQNFIKEPFSYQKADQIMIQQRYKMQKNQKQPPIPPTQTQQQLVIYVIELQMDRWYVGRTTKARLHQRIQQHKTYGKRCARWVKIFGFKRQATQYYKYDNVSPFDEDKIVKELMHLKGLNKVRGGSYARTVDLSKEETQFIIRQIQGASDCCFKCGEKGHFITKCLKLTEQRKKSEVLKRNHSGQQTKTHKDKYWFIPQCPKCLQYGHYPQQCDFEQFQTKIKQTYLKKVKCFNCGKQGHYANNCQQQSDYGYEYYDDDDWSDSGQVIYTDQRDRSNYNSNHSCWDCGTRGFTRNNCPRCKSEFNPNHYCWNCGEQGYTVDNCPECNDDDDFDPNNSCWNCGLHGYTKNNCPKCKRKSRNQQHQSQYNPKHKCFGCDKKGYTTKNCPTRQCVKKRLAVQKSGISYKNNKSSGGGKKCQRCGLPNHTYSNCINESCIRSRRR